MITTTYQVTGMTCEHCANAVTDELTNLGGVRDVAVELVPDGPSPVTVASDGPLQRGDIAAALDEAGGYQLTG